MTDTPRTDTELNRLPHYMGTQRVRADFARQLERELAVAMAELDMQAQNSRRAAMAWAEITEMRRAYEEGNGSSEVQRSVLPGPTNDERSEG